MYLITGGSGQLGQVFKSILPENSTYFPSSSELDITSKDSIQSYIDDKNIKAIINCAAYTNVDKAEDDEDSAYQINTVGVKNLAELGVPLVHISTDYVFDGEQKTPYTEIDKTNPLNVYGKTKRNGEIAAIEANHKAIVIRTSWLYSEYANNFLKTMLKLFKSNPEITVVNDQIGTPTYARHLAEFIVSVLPKLEHIESGIYHYSNEGNASWYDFACEIQNQFKGSCKILPVASSKYPTKSKRPFYSVMDKTKIKETCGIEIPHWKKGIEECLKNLF